jgi:hypothetical protein
MRLIFVAALTAMLSLPALAADYPLQRRGGPPPGGGGFRDHGGDIVGRPCRPVYLGGGVWGGCEGQGRHWRPGPYWPGRFGPRPYPQPYAPPQGTGHFYRGQFYPQGVNPPGQVCWVYIPVVFGWTWSCPDQ